jgi:hypothetical protein
VNIDAFAAPSVEAITTNGIIILPTWPKESYPKSYDYFVDDTMARDVDPVTTSNESLE